MIEKKKTIKAKVLKYEILYQGFYCGKALVQIENGDIVWIQTLKHHKINERIELCLN